LVACLANIFTDSSLDRTKRKTNFGYYNSAPRKSSSLMNLYGKLNVKKNGEGQSRMIVLKQKYTNIMCHGGGNLYFFTSI